MFHFVLHFMITVFTLLFVRLFSRGPFSLARSDRFVYGIKISKDILDSTVLRNQLQNWPKSTRYIPELKKWLKYIRNKTACRLHLN